MYAKSASWAMAAIVTVIVAAPTLSQTTTKEIRFQPPGYKFSVRFPTKPKYTRRATSTVVGDVYTDVWAVVQDDGAEYSVAITDLPSVALWFNDADDLIKKARKEMLQELGAKQAGLRAVSRGQFSEQLDYFVPGKVDRGAQRGRAWFGLLDDKLVVLTAQVPASSGSKLDRHFAAIDPGALARR